MSLHPQPVPLVPEETARVARAAFPHGNLYLVMRDAFGAMFTADDGAARDDACGDHGWPRC